MQQNRFFSHLELQNFLVGGPPNPTYQRGAHPPLVISPPPLVPSALGEHQRCSMAVPLSKSQRRPCCCVILIVHASIAIILMGKRAGCFAQFVFLVSRDCCVTLPQYAMGLSAVYDFLIILTIFKTNPSNFTFCKYTLLFAYWVIFLAFLLASAVFFSINFFFIKICQEYHQSVKQF